MDSSKTILERYYDSFNRKDIPSFLNLLSEDVKHDINQGETEVGIEAFSKFMKSMDHAYDEKISNIVIMTNQEGSSAAAKFTVEGRYKTTVSGLPEARQQKYTLECGAFFEIKDQKITRVSNFYNMQDWLKQVEA